MGRIILGSELAAGCTAVGDCLQVLVPFPGYRLGASAYTFRVVGISSLGFTVRRAPRLHQPEDARRMAMRASPSLAWSCVLRSDAGCPHRARSRTPVGSRGARDRLEDAQSQPIRGTVHAEAGDCRSALLIIVVAAFHIIASLMLIVLSKVREIAILAPWVRAPPPLLRFSGCGNLRGFAGTGLGILYGLAICGLAALTAIRSTPRCT